MAKVYASEVANCHRRARGADLRRVRVFPRVRGRAALPGRARDDHLRGHQRDPAHRDLEERAGGTMTDPEDPTLPLEEPFPEAPADPPTRSALRGAPSGRGRCPPRRCRPPRCRLGDARRERRVADPAGGVRARGRRHGTRAGLRAGRPDLLDRQEPLYRSCRGYRLRLEPPDLARLRELPGSRGQVRRRSSARPSSTARRSASPRRSPTTCRRRASCASSWIPTRARRSSRWRTRSGGS